MKNKRILIFVAALVLMVISILFLSKDIISPYVAFDDPRLKNGSYVQIIGKYDKTKPLKQHDGLFSFVIKNDTDIALTVNKNGVKPVNFEHAEQIVVLGRYNPASDIFEANNVLTKCPSKYQKEN
jgi:cytochrome c-type biogenesis protein CcmE